MVERVRDVRKHVHILARRAASRGRDGQSNRLVAVLVAPGSGKAVVGDALRLGEEVSTLALINDEKGPRVKVTLASGKQIITEKALYSIGRTGATHSLDLATAGVAATSRAPQKERSERKAISAPRLKPASPSGSLTTASI